MFAIAVGEISQVAEARRSAVALAERHGFDAPNAGRIALVVTELGTNLIKHGGGGQILAGAFLEPGNGEGIDIIALDNGPGMADMAEALSDGFSTSGTAGNGLGAVRRLSNELHLHSRRGEGCAVLARLRTGRPPAPPSRTLPLWGAVSVAKPGEEVCGDAWDVVAEPSGITVLVADGLGHGPLAAAAASEAVRLFHRHRGAPPEAIVEAMHGGLRATRGAAVAVARLQLGAGALRFCGLGNIAGAVLAGPETRRMLSHNGTAGQNARRIQALDYPLPPRSQVVLHSDGLSANWSAARYAGLEGVHPTLLAAILYRDHGRDRDDATVVVLRPGSAT